MDGNYAMRVERLAGLQDDILPIAATAAASSQAID